MDGRTSRRVPGFLRLCAEPRNPAAQPHGRRSVPVRCPAALGPIPRDLTNQQLLSSSIARSQPRAHLKSVTYTASNPRSEQISKIRAFLFQFPCASKNPQNSYAHKRCGFKYPRERHRYYPNLGIRHFSCVDTSGKVKACIGVRVLMPHSVACFPREAVLPFR
jgi:hypothetical protein